MKKFCYLEKINSLFLITYWSSTFYLFVEKEKEKNKSVQIKTLIK